jgi:hypothetical protein
VLPGGLFKSKSTVFVCHIEISYGIDPVDVDLHVQEALDRSAAVPTAAT